MLRPGELLIDDDETHGVDEAPVVDGQPMGRGYVERDYKIHPVEMFQSPSELKLIPRSEWSARIKEKVEQKSQLSDRRLTGNAGGVIIPSLNQGQDGYCWGHSTGHTVILSRAVANAPYIPISATGLCAIIKKGRNEGGWCGLSAKFAREHGFPSQKFWPQQDRSLRNDTPECRADMAKNKITEDWVDLTRDVYDQNLTFDMVATLLLSDIPCALDFNWWAHSVCGLDLVEVEPGSFGIRIWNSWGDGWSDRGMGVLRGSKAIPNGAIATRVVTARAA